ncbi:MAG: hypothetical protein ACJAVD_000989 [Porticoccaceae bacterium]|jgi:hypothetical protein
MEILRINLITFKSIITKFIYGIAIQAGKKTVDFAYFSGGIENVSPLIKSINKMLNGVEHSIQ